MSLFNRTKYTTITRRGYEITLPTNVYKNLCKQNIYIGLVLSGKSSMTVQCTDGTRYLGTLKSYMGAKGFKNGNPCDFHISNLIKE